MKHYLTTNNEFIHLSWFEAENKTMIIKSVEFTKFKNLSFSLNLSDYIVEDDFEEDKEFIKDIVNQLLNGEYELYWIE